MKAVLAGRERINRARYSLQIRSNRSARAPGWAEYLRRLEHCQNELSLVRSTVRAAGPHGRLGLRAAVELYRLPAQTAGDRNTGLPVIDSVKGGEL